MDWEETCRHLAREHNIGLGAVYRILGALAHAPGTPTLLQREVLRRLQAGRSPGEIARELEITTATIQKSTGPVNRGTNIA